MSQNIKTSKTIVSSIFISHPLNHCSGHAAGADGVADVEGDEADQPRLGGRFQMPSQQGDKDCLSKVTALSQQDYSFVTTRLQLCHSKIAALSQQDCSFVTARLQLCHSKITALSQQGYSFVTAR
jgi:hypothetical protein